MHFEIDIFSIRVIFNLVCKFSISTIRTLGFSLVSNMTLHQPIVQLINGMPHATNQLMPRNSHLICYVPTVRDTLHKYFKLHICPIYIYIKDICNLSNCVTWHVDLYMMCQTKGMWH